MTERSRFGVHRVDRGVGRQAAWWRLHHLARRLGLDHLHHTLSGVFLGAIPGVILAVFESPTTAVLTALVFLFIQQLESNILTPKIQGQILRIPSVEIFLAVVPGRDREPPRRHLRRADRRRVKGTPRLLPRSTAHQE